MPDSLPSAEKYAGCICGEAHCRRCGLSYGAANAGVLCDPPFAGSHDFPPPRDIPPEICSTCGGAFDSPPCSLSRELGLSGHTRAGGVAARDTRITPPAGKRIDWNNPIRHDEGGVTYA